MNRTTSSIMFRPLSEAPLMYVCEGFLTEAECELLVRHASRNLDCRSLAGNTAKVRTDIARRRTSTSTSGDAGKKGVFEKEQTPAPQATSRDEVGEDEGNAGQHLFQADRAEVECELLLQRLDTRLCRLFQLQGHQEAGGANTRSVKNTREGGLGVVEVDVGLLDEITTDVWQCHMTPASADNPAHFPTGSNGNRNRMSLGVHIDLNNRHFRYATVLIYLTDRFRGGQTVFPAARLPVKNLCGTTSASRRESAREKSKMLPFSAVVEKINKGSWPAASPTTSARTAASAGASFSLRTCQTSSNRSVEEHLMLLTDRNACHSGNARNSDCPELRAAGIAVEKAAEQVLDDVGSICANKMDRVARDPRPAPTGIAITPKKGSCLVFFSRTENDGAADFLSWHGGADVYKRAEEDEAGCARRHSESTEDGAKWTLQKFLEFKAGARRVAESRAFPDFVADRRKAFLRNMQRQGCLVQI